MNWYSCCYDNKRTLNISAEVAFYDPDNTSLFLFHWLYNYCRFNLISGCCYRFDQFYLFFHYFYFFWYKYIFFIIFFINVYFFSFFPYNHGSTYHWVDFIADIDECAQNTHNCSRDNATCTNTEELFNCSCNPGFSGDGHNCAGVRISQSMMFQQVKRTWPDLIVQKN